MTELSSPLKARTDSAISTLHIRELGLMEYEPVWRAMQAFTDQRDPSTTDELWMVQHPPIFTLGQAGRSEHVLDAGDIPVLHVDRGGQVTYHGPGQIVAYPLLDIRRLGMGVRELVANIEAAAIQVLDSYGVKASRAAGAPGVYVDGVKIAALGLRVRNGCSFHGLALNVNVDLEPYQRINPCGFEGLDVTRLADFNPALITQVQQRLIGRLATVLGYNNSFHRVGETLP